MNRADLLAQEGYDLSIFGRDPWWLVLLKAVVIFVFLFVSTLFMIWYERRVVARMQMRVGPNRVGPFGLLQTLADGLKLGLKEDIIPRSADRAVYLLAPVAATIPAFMAFAVIPFGPEVSIFGQQTPLQLTDLPVAVLYVLAVTSVGIYGIVLAGWSSGSTYPLLGGLRSSAQMISYEIAMALAFVAVFLYAGSMATSEVVGSQADLWYAVALAPSFFVYMIAMVGETQRAPFDLPEAEGELVGGFHTEYSSIKFAMFFLAEYINMTTVSALATTLFLGGWRAPWPISLWAGANEGWFPLLWFLAKVLVLLSIFVWLRATLPRLRYDQFMKLGWKILIPFSLGWILLVAAVRGLRNEGQDVRQIMLYGAVAIGVLLVLSFVYDLIAAGTRSRREAATQVGEPAGEPAGERAEPGTGTPEARFDPFAGGYPVPPMPGQSLPELTPVGAPVEPEQEAPQRPGENPSRPDQSEEDGSA